MRLFTLLFLLIIIFSSCEKDNPEPNPIPAVDTIYFTVEGIKASNGTISDITYTSATIIGDFESVANTTAPISQHGHCWSSERSLPTLENSEGYTELGKKENPGVFLSKLEDLRPDTRYFLRSYVIANEEIRYHPHPIAFNTLTPSIPSVLTGNIGDIGQKSVSLSGIVEQSGGSPIFEFGHCWSALNDLPTINDHTYKHGKLEEHVTDFTFNSFINDLAPGTTYYMRAFAQNGYGITYGEVKSFSTLQIDGFPIVSTSPPNDIRSNSFAIAAHLLSLGGTPQLEHHGFCWTNADRLPHLELDSYTELGIRTTTGEFTGTVTGLMANTTYNIRAYAINANGVAYGENIQVKTGAEDPVTDGLLAYYAFNSGDPETAFDYSPNGNNALHIVTELNGNTNSQEGYAVCSFQGSESFLLVQNSYINDLAAVSINCWLRKPNIGDSEYIVYSGNQEFNLKLDRTGSKEELVFQIGSASIPFTTRFDMLEDNEWHMLTFTLQKDLAKVYLDGEFVEQKPFSGSSNFSIRSDGQLFCALGLNGCMDNLRFYDRILSSNEITLLYQWER